AIGKWHLATTANGWLNHPNLAGFDFYAGTIGGAPESYFSWTQVVNGQVTSTTGYAPSDKLSDAVSWIDDQDDRPWLLSFSFNIPHTPLHLPPEEYWQSDHSALDRHSMPAQGLQDYFYAMIEAMDTFIGRLLASLDSETRENTYVIFLGDNGTSSNVISAPFRAGRAKGTIYEGGVNVPLIITGPGVHGGGVSEALVNSTDLFFTIMEMAGIDPKQVVPNNVTTDSVSFLPALSDPNAPSQRAWIYADEFFGGYSGLESPFYDYAMRNQRYKLLRFNGEEEFYDLQEDPYEYSDLLEEGLSPAEESHYASLKREVRELHDSN
ncbi:MAG: sulfatase-like hydrolase/transferase, partial [Pseudomonadota bacterium]|nr:sulfatase-like hydrolase/transferase [Pseudomonadota bacterium]